MNLLAILLFAVALPAQNTDASGDASRRLAAAQMKNPVPANAESVASGGKSYSRYCATCHGKEAKGDGSAGAKLDPKPSNLTDAEWKHGLTDGEIFLVIHDGAKNTGMKAFGSRMTEHELWDVVNYIRSLKQ